METTKLNSNILYNYPIYTNNHSKTYLKNGVYYKLFKDTYKKEIDAKVKKIKLINSLGIKDQIVLGNVEMDGSIIGYAYEVENYKNNQDLSVCSRNTKKKIHELELLKKKLEILHKNGIIHGDIRIRNLSLNNDEILFRDLDNVNIEDYSFNHSSRIQQSFINRYGIDEKLDDLAYNIAYISHLNGVIEDVAIDYVINKGKLPKTLRCAENEEIINAMITLNDKDAIKTFTIKKRH